MANNKTNAATAAAPKKRSNIRRRERSNWHGYLFMAPYALVFIAFILVPVIMAVILHNTDNQ